MQNTFTKKTLTNRILNSMSNKELHKVYPLNPLKVSKFIAKTQGVSLAAKYSRDVAINDLEKRINAL